MSYLNHAHDPRRRATAIVTVGAVHALLAVGLVTGLAVNFQPTRQPRLVGTNIPLDPPAPEPTPTPTTPPPPTTYVSIPPQPPIKLPVDTAPAKTVENAPTEATFFPTGRVDPPAPSPSPVPSFAPRRAVPSSSSAGWITNDDYPRRAIIDEAEGSVSYRLVIGTNGRVSSCELTRSTGNRALDDATCRLITNRARFEPATDENGAKVLGTFTGSVRWELPD